MGIGFLGAGKMGLPICWNIARKLERSVLVHDLQPPNLPPEAQADVHLLRFAADMAELKYCDVVVLCLPDSKAVSAVVEGREEKPGLIDILRRGCSIVDCGSSIPSETLRLAERLADRGITLNDAPVSGGLARAWNAELTVMAGGVAGDNPVLPILEAFASKIVRLENVGDGHVMKAANNYLLAANIVSFAEALRFARTAGISFEKFGEVVNNSSGASYVSANKLETVRRNDDSVSFTSALIAKDVRNFIDSCDRLGLSLPLVGNVLEVWETAIETVGGEVDSMKIYHSIGRGRPTGT